MIEIASRTCQAMNIAFSANDANQCLADFGPPTTEDVVEDYLQRLYAVADRMGVGYRDTELTLHGMVQTSIDSGPTLLLLKGPEYGDNTFAILLPRRSRSKLVVFVGGQELVVSRRWLAKNVQRTASGRYRCWLAQPMFAADAASTYNYQTGKNETKLSPFRRFLGLLKPERSDIRSIFVFAFFVGILSLTTPLAVEALVNTIAFGRYLQPLIILSLIVFVFLAFRASITVLMTIVVEIIQRRIFVRVVDDIALRLTRVPLPYLKKHHGPELVNRFFDVVQVQKVTAKLLLESLMLALQTVIGLTVLAFYHPFLLGYDIGLIALMAIVLYIIGRGAVKTAKEESVLKYETAAWLQEIVRHPTTFKFNGGLGFALDRADELSGKYIQSRQAHFHILIRQVAFSMFMQVVAATVLLGLGGFLVIDGQLTLGQLVAAELIVTVILGSFAKVGKDLESFYDLLASVDKLGKLFDLPGEPADRLQLTPQQGPAKIDLVGLKFLKNKGRVVEAVIAPGATVAIVGSSGSGKTKVIETIAGLHSPMDGYATINDFRVDLIGAASLQSQLAFLNDIEIFDGTVEENLRLGRAEIDSVSINEIFAKLEMQEAVTGMENGYKTRLSVTGFPLSTGQAIRLVLARALIAKPPALLIDSLLDRLSDEDLPVVLAELNQFADSTTILIATGRQTIADWADQLLTTS